MKKQSIAHRAGCGLFAFVMFFVPTVAVAADGETKRFPFPGLGTLQLEVPKSWQHRISQPRRGSSSTLVLTSDRGPTFQVLISPLLTRRPGTPFPEPRDLRKEAEQSARIFQPQAVEKEIRIQELKGRAAIGYYYSLTDRAPKPGEFKYMTQGMVRLGDALLAFTLLANDGYAAIRDRMIAALQGGSFTVD